jgi:chromosome partitioning protein
MAAKPPVLVFANQKGGVGKSTVTAGTAGELAQRGMRALVIDLDPQANITAWLAPPVIERTSSDVLYSPNVEGALAAAITPSSWPGVDVVPGEQELATREAERVAGADFRLRRAIRGSDLSAYDLVLIDTGPSLGPLLMNAMNAADFAVVVTDAERFGVTGVAYVLDTITVITEDSNPGLQVAGIVMNKYDARTAEHPGRWNELVEKYGGMVWARLPARAVVATASSTSLPVQQLRGDGAWPLGVKDLTDRLLNLELSYQ